MKTIIFVDIDSTIVENRFSRKAIGELLEELANATGLTIEELGQEIGQENGERQRNDPDNALTMDWDDILETVAKRHGVILSKKVIDLWTRYASPELIDVLDNAPQVMQDLKKQPHRTLVIATKGLSKYQDAVLDAVNMRDHFDDYLTPDITHYLKTSPEYFSKYTTLENTCFIQVGDHYYDDVICAKRNGFYAVMRAPIEELRSLDPFERPQKIVDYREQIHTYPKKGTDILPDAVVVSLEEVPSVIERIEAIATTQ